MCHETSKRGNKTTEENMARNVSEKVDWRNWRVSDGYSWPQTIN